MYRLILASTIIALGLLGAITETLALECYSCGSPQEDSGCEDPYDQSFKTNCEAPKSESETPPNETEMSNFCVKQTILISDWQTSKVDGIETRKRMYKPQFNHYCAKLPANTPLECTPRNSAGVSQSTCFCNTNLCNKSPPIATRNSQLLMSFITSLVALFILRSNP